MTRVINKFGIGITMSSTPSNYLIESWTFAIFIQKNFWNCNTWRKSHWSQIGCLYFSLLTTVELWKMASNWTQTAAPCSSDHTWIAGLRMTLLSLPKTWCFLKEEQVSKYETSFAVIEDDYITLLAIAGNIKAALSQK